MLWVILDKTSPFLFYTRGAGPWEERPGAGKRKKPRGLEAPRFSGMSSQEDWGRGRGIVRQNNLQTDGLNQSPRDTLVLNKEFSKPSGC